VSEQAKREEKVVVVVVVVVDDDDVKHPPCSMLCNTTVYTMSLILVTTM
jgi:hypothetical protein